MFAVHSGDYFQLTKRRPSVCDRFQMYTISVYDHFEEPAIIALLNVVITWIEYRQFP